MTTKQLKKLSTYTLEERLDLFCSIKAKLHDYRHIIEDTDILCVSVQEEINNIVDILEEREI